MSRGILEGNRKPKINPVIMNMLPSLFRPIPAILALLALVAAAPLRAGTPLICFPYEIGQAKSLPGDAKGPKGVSTAYDRTKLVPETLALLTPEMPVIVRMETIRRAVVYAVKGEFFASRYPAEDQRFISGLLAGLKDRTLTNDPKERALANFDLGFLSETLRQAGVDSSLNGYKLLLLARELRGPDAEMEFALALASSWPKNDDFSAHLAKARAGAAKDQGSLLAQNLASHLSGS
jgi:hypothetical protein